MSKRKLTVPKRNPFVVLALKKTGAGSHRKTNKALRKRTKQSGYSSAVEQKTFNLLVVGSIPTARTSYHIETHSLRSWSLPA
jgi:hypothetical protein